MTKRRRPLALSVGVVALLYAAGGACLLADLASIGTLAWGFALTALVLGARHAFDADHLAAIDDSTRLMVANGRSAHGVGLAFALGHSTIVLALGAFVGLAVSPLASAEVHRWQEVGTQISMLVAIGFLGVVGWFNARSLRNVSRLRREAVWRTVSQEELDGAMRSRGTVLRVVGSKRAGGALGMYAIGLLFGLGMETASEIALLALTDLCQGFRTVSRVDSFV